MKKSKIKFVIRNAMKIYYKNGLTNTSAAVQCEIMSGIDKLYSKINKK